MFLLFNSLITVAAGFFGIPLRAQQTKVVDCGAGKSLFTIQAVSLDPPQPIANQNVSLRLDYSVPAGLTVTGGDATYAATYNFIPLSPTVEPLCSSIPCPLSSGSYSNVSYTLWPSGLSGNLVTKITWTDTDSRLLLCMSITASF